MLRQQSNDYRLYGELFNCSSSINAVLKGLNYVRQVLQADSGSVRIKILNAVEDLGWNDGSNNFVSNIHA